MLLRASASTSIYRCAAVAQASLVCQRRHLEYWGATVTGRTQPYAQGDVLPRLDNTQSAINKGTSAAASMTGNPSGIAYDASNIFSVENYSILEKEHYQPLRGITKHKVEPLQKDAGPAVAALLEDLASEGVLEEYWWGQLLKDFPSLEKPCTPAFQKSWEEFYRAACAVAHDDAAVTVLSKPFLRVQMQKNYISYAMVWRFAERLADAMETAPDVTKYERRASRLVVERVTKLMLDTIADEPWAMQETTSPLNVDISNFRAWHEAGNW